MFKNVPKRSVSYSGLSVCFVFLEKYYCPTLVSVLLSSCPRSCYVVFPCQQIVLALGCLMGLVMFARYGEDSPLDKGYVKTNDQVKFLLAFILFLKDFIGCVVCF